MIGVELIKDAAYAVLGAHLLHELTHYVIALVLLRKPSFGIFGIRESGVGRYIGTLHVDHDAYPYVTLGDFLIHVGPTIIGGLAALAWILTGGPTPEIWMVVGWFVYTLLGLPNDVRFREVDDEPESAAETLADGAGCVEAWESTSEYRRR